jgi:drug/metabolite transporter (DMT)-like permease
MVSFISSGAGLIALAALLWGLDGILRRSLYTLQPITIVFFEHLIGTIILLPFLVRIWGREKLTKNEWLAVVLVSLLSGVLGTLFFTTALAKVNYIPFSVVFLLQKLQPIFTMAFAALVLKERLTKHYFLWAALAVWDKVSAGTEQCFTYAKQMGGEVTVYMPIEQNV